MKLQELKNIITLQELKNIITFDFDFSDNEIDAVFYVELEAINEKYAKKIEVVKISSNYVLCKFTDFLRNNKKEVKKYLLENYHKSGVLEWLLNNLVYAEDITADDGEAVWYFMENDLAEFLVQE